MGCYVFKLCLQVIVSPAAAEKMKHYICRREVCCEVHNRSSAIDLYLRSFKEMILYVMFIDAEMLSCCWRGRALFVKLLLMPCRLSTGLLKLIRICLGFFGKGVKELSKAIFCLGRADRLPVLVSLHGCGNDILCEALL